jgi:hypothetical protein
LSVVDKEEDDDDEDYTEEEEEGDEDEEESDKDREERNDANKLVQKTTTHTLWGILFTSNGKCRSSWVSLSKIIKKLKSNRFTYLLPVVQSHRKSGIT